MVAIGVTNSVNVSEINAIASPPSVVNAFFTEDFDGLLRIVDSIATAACGRGSKPVILSFYFVN